MKDLNELELYDVDCKGLASDEDFNFYHDELVKIRKEQKGIIIAWIVQDAGVGHVEFKCFRTWDEAATWIKQN